MPPSSYAKRPLLNRDTAKDSFDFARRILSRGESSDLPPDTEDGADSMINLMLVILGLVFFTLILLSAFFLFRRYRRQQRMSLDMLPTYNESKQHHHQNHSRGHKPPYGLTIETSHDGRSSTIYINRNGQPMLANPNSPPHSPDNVPEIHITFPDEQDDQGKHRSGRVLVVRVGDNATVGLEPMQDEQLPAYEKESKDGFYSLDMDQLGGLKEKDPALFK
ncbi:hypothetical protein ACRE_001110 [Hapsidospora chrysogenum ATCC 11550]|uniref:Uncharacterized protein n=1 Tax=Hapsidospora chrysogenum (strain ATCC 11550 / CBS 779.69 / DSM 880 / IAM 14645 / JCM 23072 / IMI 49137) TaxID=857340 RepID=A0A086THW4_HAPC1|nr:hypothetical protein ACRE_001110 [Hapsidospora chrysogenum ATCC 11550]